MREVYVVDGVRTGIARAGKNSWFANLRADDMTAMVINEVLRRTGLEEKKKQIDDVIIGGTALVKDMGGNIGRLAGIMAGLPYDVPGCTIDRFLRFGTADHCQCDCRNQHGVAGLDIGWRHATYDACSDGKRVL